MSVSELNAELSMCYNDDIVVDHSFGMAGTSLVGVVEHNAMFPWRVPVGLQFAMHSFECSLVSKLGISL
jgi:hypothetical protein